jgi:hypothetical protein
MQERLEKMTEMCEGVQAYKLIKEYPKGVSLVEQFVKLTDLVSVVGQLPEEILKNFWDLAGHIIDSDPIGFEKQLLFADQNGIVDDVASIIPPVNLEADDEDDEEEHFIDSEDAERAYISIQWAREIVLVCRAGAVEVRGDWIEHDDPEKQCWSVGMLGCTLNDDGYCYVVSATKSDGSRITTGPRPEKTWKEIEAELDEEDRAREAAQR